MQPRCRRGKPRMWQPRPMGLAPERATEAVRAKQEQPDYVFAKLWGLVTDPRNLRIAVARVARNRGRRTAGVDRVTVRMVVRARRWTRSSKRRATQLRPAPTGQHRSDAC